MPEPAPILDYASPLARTKLRLPTSSVLSIVANDRSIHITEELAGKGSAIGAIVFACFVLFVLFVLIWQDLAWTLRHVSLRRLPVCFSLLWLTEASVLAAVINNTWRKTIVIADSAAGLAVTFTSPAARRQFSCDRGEIVDLRVAKLGLNLGAVPEAAEIVIVTRNRPAMYLFSGHEQAELEPLAAALRGTLGLAA